MPLLSTPIGRSASIILWGLFCACSWTWCIGMYLPRIMIERFGWWGFIAFAVPNVLGCAAFGYVLRSRSQSQMMVANHRRGMIWFSAITIAYHMFFIPFLFALVVPEPDSAITVALPYMAALIAYALGAVLSFLPDRDWLALAALVYGVSLAAFIWLGGDGLRQIAWSGSQELHRLAWLTPVLFLGFLLCPYLDLTFHRALQQSPSVHAFSVFGVTFVVMILLTCAIWFSRESALSTIVMLHIMSQSIFTVGAHLREMRLSDAFANRVSRALAMVLPLLAIPILLLASGFSNDTSLGEDLYLRFLVFYGLVFPVYVLLFVGSGAVARRTIGIVVFFALIVLGAMPLYELGFIHGRTWLLSVAAGALLTIALAARLIGRSMQRSRLDNPADRSSDLRSDVQSRST